MIQSSFMNEAFRSKHHVLLNPHTKTTSLFKKKTRRFQKPGRVKSWYNLRFQSVVVVGFFQVWNRYKLFSKAWFTAFFSLVYLWAKWEEITPWVPHQVELYWWYCRVWAHPVSTASTLLQRVHLTVVAEFQPFLATRELLASSCVLRIANQSPQTGTKKHVHKYIQFRHDKIPTISCNQRAASIASSCLLRICTQIATNRNKETSAYIQFRASAAVLSMSHCKIISHIQV